VGVKLAKNGRCLCGSQCIGVMTVVNLLRGVYGYGGVLVCQFSLFDLGLRQSPRNYGMGSSACVAPRSAASLVDITT
jgi:hypothetical protein